MLSVVLCSTQVLQCRTHNGQTLHVVQEFDPTQVGFWFQLESPSSLDNWVTAAAAQMNIYAGPPHWTSTLDPHTQTPQCTTTLNLHTAPPQRSSIITAHIISVVDRCSGTVNITLQTPQWPLNEEARKKHRRRGYCDKATLFLQVA